MLIRSLQLALITAVITNCFNEIQSLSLSMSKVSSKKLINSPASVVPDAVEGLLLTDSRLIRVSNLNIVVRRDINESKEKYVSIIAGGGAGHEPAHAGFIGEGMLSGAVIGNVFASPSVSAILAAIRVVSGPKGVLLVVKNYTGDKLNFGMAMEKARQEKINVKMVIVDDDCALPIGKGITGGRGVAGTTFVHKIAGAAAAAGLSLDEGIYIYTYIYMNITCVNKCIICINIYIFLYCAYMYRCICTIFMNILYMYM